MPFYVIQVFSLYGNAAPFCYNCFGFGLYEEGGMAVVEKVYQLPPEFLLNAIYDVAEMRKAKVARISDDELEMVTEMYRIKTTYRFRLERGSSDVKLSVDSDGEDENAQRDAEFMLAVLDGLVSQITGQ